MYGFRRRGLGATYKIGSGGQVVDCDLWSNMLESVCWVPSWLGGPSQQVIPAAPATDPATGATTYQPDPTAAANVAGGLNPDGSNPANNSFPWGTVALIGGAGLVGLVAVVAIGGRR